MANAVNLAVMPEDRVVRRALRIFSHLFELDFASCRKAPGTVEDEHNQNLGASSRPNRFQAALCVFGMMQSV